MKAKVEKWACTKAIPRTKIGVFDWIREHKRFHCANSWNKSRTFGHSMKLYELGLTNNQLSVAFDLCNPDTYGYEEFWEILNHYFYQVRAEFFTINNGSYTLGLNKGKYLNIYRTCGNDVGDYFPYRAVFDEIEFTDHIDYLREIAYVLKSLDNAADKIRAFFIQTLNTYIDEQKSV